jgi:hypothetical protein
VKDLSGISKTRTRFAARTLALATALVALASIFATPAFATFEQVGTFGDSGEAQIPPAGGTASTAVNITGAGGVPAGSVYAVTSAGAKVFRFTATGEFAEAFGAVQEPRAVAVDPANGFVYVAQETPAQGKVEVFTAKGEPVTSFGEQAAFGQTVGEDPEKIYEFKSGGMAVDGSGTVYVVDSHASTNFESRIMVFKPQSPGDFEHYVYAGRSQDIGASHGSVNYQFENQLALDDNGNVFASSVAEITKFNLATPSAPVCQYKVPGGGLTGMTVNPQTDEVFYFSFKNNKFHQLSDCNAKGEFTEVSSFEAPRHTLLNAGLSINPTLAFTAARPPGVLYGLDAGIPENGKPDPSRGDIFGPAVVLSPTVESESVTSVGATSAVLGAQINPKGSLTRYVFQYISETGYQANEIGDRFAGAAGAPVGGAVLGSGQAGLSAAIAVAGLQPETEYHYRVVAENCNPGDEPEACTVIGSDLRFRTLSAQASRLPDGRAYELVSPVDKHGGQVYPANPEVFSPCVARLFCKFGHLSESFPMQVAPDGNSIVYEGTSFSPTEGAAGENEYLARRTSSGWESSDLSPALASVGSQQGYKAVSPDLSRAIIYQDRPALSLAAPAGFANLYSQSTSEPGGLVPLVQSQPPGSEPGSDNFQIQYAGASTDLSHALFEANDALTAPTADAPEPAVGGVTQNNLYESADGVLRLVNVLPGNEETQPGAVFAPSHPISDDGSRVFWSAEGGQGYVRMSGTQTLAIPGGGRPLTASADGSKVLLDDGLLFNVNDLSEAPVDLTDGKGGFEGIIGQSEDLSSIFFVDTAVLDETENDQHAVAQPGGYNLYAYRDGTVGYIATLVAIDNNIGSTPPVGDWRASPSARTAEASPDGRWVAFLSASPLTGYDNECTACHQNSAGEFGGGQVKEAFLYDSASGTLTCPSCNPTGESPLGETRLPRLGSRSNLKQLSYLTDSGRLFFDTEDSLSPSDTNGQFEDVYEYEPSGIGTCAREAGCVSLLSGGREAADSNFIAADPSGTNVFFTTRDQLQLRDRDNLFDLYDAREGGGIAAETESARTECQGEACQPSIIAPNDVTPPSSSFQGPGNPVEKTGKKKHHKKKHHKKNNKAKKKDAGRGSHGRAADGRHGGQK